MGRGRVASCRWECRAPRTWKGGGLGDEIQDTGYKMQDTKCNMQDTRYKIQEMYSPNVKITLASQGRVDWMMRYRIQDTRCNMQDTRYKVQETRNVFVGERTSIGVVGGVGYRKPGREVSQEKSGLDDARYKILFLFLSAFLHRRGSVCDRF